MIEELKKVENLLSKLNATVCSTSDSDIEASKEFDKWIKINPVRSSKDVWSWGWNTIRLWMHNNGVYMLPTIELNDFIFSEFFPESTWPDERMDKEVIEIAAGTGMLGRMLGILMTDSHLQQTNKMVMMYYDIMRQPRIKYPSDVIRMDANRAVRYYKPHTIIGSYVTWGSSDSRVCEELGANQYGPDMIDLYNHVNRIILIGNENIKPHITNPLLKYEHKTYTDVPGLITRSDPTKNRIWVWEHTL